MNIPPAEEASALRKASDPFDVGSGLAPPLTPPDCDLRSTGMTFMPVDVGRLIDSDLFAISSGEELGTGWIWRFLEGFGNPAIF